LDAHYGLDDAKNTARATHSISINISLSFRARRG